MKTNLAIWMGFLSFVLALVFPLKANGSAEWHILDTPRFAIVSQIDEHDTRAWADDFNQFMHSLLGLLKIKEGFLPKVTLVIFDDKKSFQPFFQIGPNGQRREPAGYCAHHEIWPFLAMTGQYENEKTRHIIFHEATHWVMSTDGKRYPAWINEGMAELFSSFSIGADRMKWGEEIQEHMVALKQNALIPLRELLSASYSSRLFENSSRRTLFYAQSWAFVHYLTFGDRTGQRGTLGDFIAEYQRAFPTEKTFEKVFGANYLQMEALLRQYLRNGQHRTASAFIPVSEKIKAPFQPASPAVLEIAFARLASLAGHKELARKHAEEAVRLNPSADSYTALAWAQINSNEFDAACETAGKAVQLNGQDSGTLWLLAEARYKKTRATGKMSAEEAREIALLSQATITRSPSIKSAYIKLAAVLPNLEKNEPTEQDDQFLQLGQKLFPHEPAIQIGRAQLAQIRGEKEEALKMLDAVASNFPRSLTAEQRQQVQNLRSLCGSPSKIENGPPAEKEPAGPAPHDSAMESHSSPAPAN